MTGKDLLHSFQHIDEELVIKADCVENVKKKGKFNTGFAIRTVAYTCVAATLITLILNVSDIVNVLKVPNSTGVSNSESNSNLVDGSVDSVGDLVQSEDSTGYEENSMDGASDANNTDNELKVSFIEEKRSYIVSLAQSVDGDRVIESSFNRDQYHTPKDGEVVLSNRLMETVGVYNGYGSDGSKVYYFVSIDILKEEQVSETGKTRSFSVLDDELLFKEYERLTRECGLDLTWIPGGAYEFGEGGKIYLGAGIICGALTKEQLFNFPVSEEYGFAIIIDRDFREKYKNATYRPTFTQEEFDEWLETIDWK